MQSIYHLPALSPSSLAEEDPAVGSPYDKDSMAIIRLNNTTVVYLKELTKFLAMVCFLREENFERKGQKTHRVQCSVSPSAASVPLCVRL